MFLSRGALAALLLGVGWAGQASAAQPPQAPGPRTGPDATPPAAPAFPQPVPPLFDPALPPAAAPSPGQSATAIRAVRVLADRAGRDHHAVPPPAWRPSDDPISGFRLDHRPGEPLGAAWVERQFALNAVADSGRAIALVQLINRAFLAAGFVNSGLLVADSPDDGVLALDLVHGRAAGQAGGRAVTVRWADGNARGLRQGYIRDRMPSARRQPLNAVLIERDFRLLAEDPAIRTVNAQLRPGARPGEASLDLTVLPVAPGDVYFTAGNSRSPAVGGERYAFGTQLRNFFASGDIVSVEAGVTRGVSDASLGYYAPIDRATAFTLRASYNAAAVIDTPLLPLDIRTRDRTIEGSILRQLLRTPLTPDGDARWSPSQTLTAGIGLVSRQQRSFLLGEPFSFAPGAVDGQAKYTAIRLIGDYVMRNVDEVFAGSITATMGLDGTRSDQPFVRNPDENFVALLVQLNYARRLTAGGLELRARFTGQVAGSILYSGERLSIGGEASVRGYRESLILADEGAIGSLELALPLSLSGSAGRGSTFDWGAFTIAAFGDAAFSRNRAPPPTVPDAIGSVGLALTWQPSDALTLRLSYGHALVEVDPTGSRNIQDDGVHVRLTVRPLRLFGLD